LNAETTLPTKLVIDQALIRKFGGNGPRYTSYPTADRFVEAFDAAAYAHWLANRNVGGFIRPLSLYVHLPFCDTICCYCACNKVVTRRRERSAAYVRHLAAEAGMVARTLNSDRAVTQMHWGGGTPTFLADAELAALMRALRSEFALAPDGQYAVELDPRRVGPERIAFLAGLGFNRISVGVQDVDPRVQRAVNRVQSFEETEAVIRAARRHGFRLVNVDLIYGLPLQTPEGFARTLELVAACAPDRVALYPYAHRRAVFKPQRRIAEADLPAPETKLELLVLALERLQAAGYVCIGMDHFAKPGDDLALAQGRLTQNFQGYSRGGDADIVGLGVSAISKVGPTYAQNAKVLEEYEERVDQGVLPTLRGIELGADDLVRRAAIQALACHFEVSKESISIAHLIDFDRYFVPELEALAELERDGLVRLHGDWISVTPQGRLLVRAVCMVFDKYLQAANRRAGYSKLI
jgi:oxygen-independent coproporphyrinogen-3 oxidase